MTENNPVISKNITEIFKLMNSNKDKQFTKSESDTLQNQNPQTTIDTVTQEANRTVCRLLNIQIREFFDNIYIPFSHFKSEEWDISDVLNRNDDVLFYNENFMSDNVNEKHFYDVFDKYVKMIEEIMNPNSALMIFLKKWTDMSDIRWKSTLGKSYLKSILTGQEYDCISPIYIVNYYIGLTKKYQNMPDKAKVQDQIKTDIESHLDDIMKKVKRETNKFKRAYHKIVDAYVYQHPVDSIDEDNLNNEKQTYVKDFICTVILAIVDFADKLIDLHIYKIHPIVLDVIDYYLPLDELNHYDLEEHDGRKMYII
jgi:hypothetical protein